MSNLLRGFLVLGLVVYRALWAGSSTASAAGLGRLPVFPEQWRRWLLGEDKKFSE